MIVKMKKYVFLVYHKQYATFLEQLRDVGVLHVAEKPQGITENDQLRKRCNWLPKLKKQLTEAETSILPDTIPHEVTSYNRRRLLRTFDALQTEKARLQQRLPTHKKRLITHASVNFSSEQPNY